MEGLGLPPLEAALSGNKVIGYSGQGGKEYWIKSIFKEVENGDVIELTNSILHEIANLDDNKQVLTQHSDIEHLKSIYSTQQEENDLRKIFEFLTGITKN